MATMEMNQDYELDEGGDVEGPLLVWWCEGHGHDALDVLSAVAEHSLDHSGSVPQMGTDDVCEVWQYQSPLGFWIRKESDPKTGSETFQPVTVVDLERSRNGAPRCSISGCQNRWHSATPLRIIAYQESDYMAVYLPLCSDHRALVPNPYYRTLLVPVGSIAVLPENDNIHTKKNNIMS